MASGGGDCHCYRGRNGHVFGSAEHEHLARAVERRQLRSRQHVRHARLARRGRVRRARRDARGDERRRVLLRLGRRRAPHPARPSVGGRRFGRGSGSGQNSRGGLARRRSQRQRAASGAWARADGGGRRARRRRLGAQLRQVLRPAGGRRGGLVGRRPGLIRRTRAFAGVFSGDYAGGRAAGAGEFRRRVHVH